MGKPEMNSTLRRIRWLAAMDTSSAGHSKRRSTPPVVVVFLEQMRAMNNPSSPVSAKVTLSTVPAVIERSNELDHSPA